MKEISNSESNMNIIAEKTCLNILFEKTEKEIENRIKTDLHYCLKNNYIPTIVFIQKYTKIYNDLKDISEKYAINIVVDESVHNLIYNQNNKNFENSIQNPKKINSTDLIRNLEQVGFTRQLRDFQEKNVIQLLKYPNTATFSVPGAGKTTEALAAYAYRKNQTKKPLQIFIVSPLNAFAAWDEQIHECLPKWAINQNVAKFKNKVARLSAPNMKITDIENILKKTPDVCIVNYEKLQNDQVNELVENYLAKNDVFMILDESHKIKGSGIRTKSTLKLSLLPKYKLIMTGTPMPHSSQDLISQLVFLYPQDKHSITETNVQAKMQKIYARTTKNKLGIKAVNCKVRKIEMSEEQTNFYNLIKGRAKSKLIKLHKDQKNKLKQLNKTAIRLMQVASNPRLIINSDEFSDLRDIELIKNLPTEIPRKFQWACNRARDLARQGKKVIIWTGFVKNVRFLHLLLEDLNAMYIDGSVPAGDEEEEHTRENIIHKFKTKPDHYVLIANPAACSEGISLHLDKDKNPLCNHAIYVDRNYDAAQYIQSIDRIHRLGLPKHINTHIDILQTEQHTIDTVIQDNLDRKIEAMKIFLEDESLNSYSSEGAEITSENISSYIDDFEKNIEKHIYA